MHVMIEAVCIFEENTKKTILPAKSSYSKSNLGSKLKSSTKTCNTIFQSEYTI